MLSRAISTLAVVMLCALASNASAFNQLVPTGTTPRHGENVDQVLKMQTDPLASPVTVPLKLAVAHPEINGMSYFFQSTDGVFRLRNNTVTSFINPTNPNAPLAAPTWTQQAVAVGGDFAVLISQYSDGAIAGTHSSFVDVYDMLSNDKSAAWVNRVPKSSARYVPISGNTMILTPSASRTYVVWPEYPKAVGIKQTDMMTCIRVSQIGSDFNLSQIGNVCPSANGHHYGSPRISEDGMLVFADCPNNYSVPASDCTLNVVDVKVSPMVPAKLTNMTGQLGGDYDVSGDYVVYEQLPFGATCNNDLSCNTSLVVYNWRTNQEYRRSSTTLTNRQTKPRINADWVVFEHRTSYFGTVKPTQVLVWNKFTDQYFEIAPVLLKYPSSSDPAHQRLPAINGNSIVFFEVGTKADGTADEMVRYIEFDGGFDCNNPPAGWLMRGGAYITPGASSVVFTGQPCPRSPGSYDYSCLEQGRQARVCVYKGSNFIDADMIVNKGNFAQMTLPLWRRQALDGQGWEWKAGFPTEGFVASPTFSLQPNTPLDVTFNALASYSGPNNPNYLYAFVVTGP